MVLESLRAACTTKASRLHGHFNPLAPGRQGPTTVPRAMGHDRGRLRRFHGPGRGPPLPATSPEGALHRARPEQHHNGLPLKSQRVEGHTRANRRFLVAAKLLGVTTSLGPQVEQQKQAVLRPSHHWRKTRLAQKPLKPQVPKRSYLRPRPHRCSQRSGLHELARRDRW